MIGQQNDCFLKTIRWILAIVFLLILYYFNYYLDRTHFTLLISLYGLAFIIYLSLLHKRFFEQRDHFKDMIVLAIFARFILLFSVPNLSDDYYRFLWDGWLINNGFNPFDFRPSDFMNDKTFAIAPLQLLFDKMNSPDYFSVYPPINQYIFSLTTFLFPNSISGAVMIIKLFLFGFELLAIFSLYKITQQLHWSKHTVLWYALNPLVIIEFCGNLHFEGIMIGFLLFSIYLLTINRHLLSALVFSGAILTKLHPLMLLPFFLKYLGGKRSIPFVSIVGIICVLASAPLLLPFHSSLSRLYNITNSLELYYQTFEFNGGFYYLLRAIGYHIYGYNAIQLIGKILLLLNIIGLFILFIKQKRTIKSLILSIALAYFIYNLLATTVHPWYILSILPFALLVNFKTPIVWTAVIILSYFAYSTIDWHENFYFIILEYTLIFAVLLYELQTTKLLHEAE